MENPRKEILDFGQSPDVHFFDEDFNGRKEIWPDGGKLSETIKMEDKSDDTTPHV